MMIVENEAKYKTLLVKMSFYLQENKKTIFISITSNKVGKNNVNMTPFNQRPKRLHYKDACFIEVGMV